MLFGIGLAGVSVLAMFGLIDHPIDAKSTWFIWLTGVSFCLAGAFTVRGARLFGLVTLSLIVGGGAQLWLTEPLWFPAIQLRPKDTTDLIMFALIGAQAAAALWVLFKFDAHKRLGHGLREFGIWRVLVFLTLSFGFSVSLQAYLPRGFFGSLLLHLIAASAMIMINLASVAALLAVPAPKPAARTIKPLLLASIALVASAALSWFGFERLPHVEDEAVYLFQAKTFAGGALSVPAPPEAMRPGLEFFLLEIRDGRWFSTTPHGWPAILSLGVLLGIPWLVNPLLGAVSVLLAHAITRQLAGRQQADILAMLMVASPWFLQSSASLMPHNTAIFCSLVSWWLLLRTPLANRHIWAMAGLAGLAMGWVFVTRQLEGVIVGTLTGIWLVWQWYKGAGPTRTIAYSLGAIVAGSTFFVYNYAMTGNPMLAPLDRYITELWHVGANAYGFGPDIGPPQTWKALDMAPGHGPLEGLLNTLHNLFALQLELFGWGIGSLALVFAMFIWGRPTRQDAALSVICIFIGAAMFLYWSSGGFYIGPRYWFAMFFPVLYLSSGGAMTLSDRLTKMGVRSPASTLLVLCLFGLLVFTPWRGLEKFHGYNNYQSDIAQQASNLEIANALVFFDTPKNPKSALYLNDPFLPDNQPIFLVNMGDATNRAAIDANPGRRVVNLTGTLEN